MLHINNFVDKIKFFESKNSKDFIMPMHEAKNLHADITKLLLAVHELQHQTPTTSNNNDSQSTVSGGSW